MFWWKKEACFSENTKNVLFLLLFYKNQFYALFLMKPRKYLMKQCLRIHIFVWWKRWWNRFVLEIKKAFFPSIKQCFSGRIKSVLISLLFWNNPFCMFLLMKNISIVWWNLWWNRYILYNLLEVKNSDLCEDEINKK